MSSRVKTALVLGSVFLAVLFFGGVGWFAALIAAIAVVGAREYADLAWPEANSLESLFVPLWAGAVALGFATGSPQVPGALLALGAGIYFLAWIAGPGPGPQTRGRWAAALGAWVFVGLFLGHGVWVRRHGVAPVVFLALTVWAGDVAAYYVGSAFGTHLLAPAVSPKKTVEGAAASVAASVAVAALLGLVLPLPHSAWSCVPFGFAINLAAQLGDLAESLLKRCAGVKDSGNLFPGHGGVLDRVDAFLLALPLYAALLGNPSP